MSGNWPHVLLALREGLEQGEPRNPPKVGTPPALGDIPQKRGPGGGPAERGEGGAGGARRESELG